MQITELTGPESAFELGDVPEPESSHPFAPESPGVIVDVRAAGVSFPEVLQTRGEYQIAPELPFVPGSEVAGIVRSAPDDAEVSAGDRVAAFCVLGGFAEVAVAPPFFAFPLSDELDFAQGAGLILNYHTAWFALMLRARLAEGETVLVHGAAGGVGTATIQVARGPGRGSSGWSRATRRSAWPVRPERTRWCAPTAPGRTRPASSPTAGSTW
ncbi:MAG: alcohol dehydrogenase catalytic domain-containing protein [Thermoleophilaceae bacterium]